MSFIIRYKKTGKEIVWRELEKEARLYKRDAEELAGIIIESNYILNLKGKEYED